MVDASPDAATVLMTDLGVLCGCIALSKLLDPVRAVDRAIFGGLTAILIVAYTAWRLFDTIPGFEFGFGAIWQRFYFVFEAIAILYTLMSIVILLRHTDHSATADVAEAEIDAANSWPPVDVFICTYNEPVDVLEKSVLLSRALDYPDVRIWVLDDTRRPWLREYCNELGVNYLTRSSNEWAKAGNLNNGLRLTAGPRAAPLILVLDADFAPHSNLLKRTVGLFRDPKIAVVQTPQLYFNADPIQHNLMASKAWIDDQRIFFDVFQPAKDAWGAAFCVGTTFLVRRDRLNEIGGFPHEAVSEDINLTYTMMSHGYVTRWLNERLSVGLAAEGLPEYITQRARWCLGTIQVALLRNGPFRGANFTMVQRLHYLHGVLNWLCKPFIVLMLLAPAVYWFFGIPAFEADYVDFLGHAVPALLAFYAYSGWVSRRRTLPIFMEVTHMVTAVAVTWTLITCLYRPFGRPFKVTDKGGDRSRTIVRWDMLRIFGGLCAVSVGAIIWALIGPNAPTEATPVDILNLVWAGISSLLAGVACIVCFEKPRLHREELFQTDHVGQLRTETGLLLPCSVHRLSTVDASLSLAQEHRDLTIGTAVDLVLDGLQTVGGHVSFSRGRDLLVSLSLPEAQRRDMVVALYRSPNDNLPLQADMGKALAGLLRRSIGRD
ncbi:glycosyltransferase family 2 protein [Lichenihabitans psoromatis]|uniref:glycosyltransferase family 2 protein n=1 Tax=Lichenihabitans psoromatis TaxID=2528642 RepID=UPI00103563FC|nr:cellulose synthase catalytic subunit [Lichenihabitans psoromatis]